MSIRQEWRWDGVLKEEVKSSGIVLFRTPEGAFVRADSSEPDISFAGIYEVQRLDCPTLANSNISVIWKGEARARSTEALKAGDYVTYDPAKEGMLKKAADKADSIGKALEPTRTDQTFKLDLWGK